MANSIHRRRYPIGIQDFAEIREENYYYVDKTGLVYDLANENKFVFMSRPRRFGKSLLVSTLAAYFEGRKELFEGLAMERLETEWRQYPVLHFSFASVKEVTQEGIRSNISYKISLMEKKYGIRAESDDFSIRMETLINGCYEKYGERVAVLFDEYDAPLLNVLSHPQLLPEVRQMMRTVYAPLKDCGPRLRFLFITGITKFLQLSIFSDLDNLHHISMLDEYATICGFTQQELEDTFSEGITQMGKELEMTREEVIDRMRVMYDGYHFANGADGVYNPFSVIRSLKERAFNQYCFATGTPTFLVDTMRKFHTDITRIDGKQALATQFDEPTEDMQSILPLFYQSGYITIKDYDRDSDRYLLGYPNKEVRLGMTRTLNEWKIG